MPRDLSVAEEAKVNASRKTTKPSVYDPNGTTATVVTNDFETWLILADKSTKQKAIKQINALLEMEEDKDYQDLFKEAAEKEKDSLEAQASSLESNATTFTDWRDATGIQGFEDVAEIGWMMQELQQGVLAAGEIEELEHLEKLREAAETRLLTSKDSTASRKTRLNAWLAALSSY
jgi:hypothetical protein